eukprot:6158948-Lingulodinium_polyedra.AAC.1
MTPPDAAPAAVVVGPSARESVGDTVGTVSGSDSCWVADGAVYDGARCSAGRLPDLHGRQRQQGRRGAEDAAPP